MIRVAALYVLAASSPYEEMPDVDCWPMKRDARLYEGPWAIVAHPPCGPWSRRWSHAVKPRPEQDPELARIAVGQVRKWGGILEHGEDSILWGESDLGLPFPIREKHAVAVRPDVHPRDEHGGYTIEVRQANWGHHSPKKLTWLYMVGVDSFLIQLPPHRESPPPDRVSWRRRPSGLLTKRNPSDLASPEKRKRSPPDFARWLVDLAATAAVS